MHTHSPSPMENRFKMRISRMFRSSFGSCKTKNISDVTEKAVFAPQTSHTGFQLIAPLSPKVRPSPSICRPKRAETSETMNGRCIVSVKDSLPRRKVSEWSSPFIRAYTDGRSCPPASPSTPLKPIYEEEFGFNEKIENSVKNKRNKKKKKKHIQQRSKPREIFPFNSCAKDDNFGGYWWYNSDDDDDDEGEDETDTLFSSKSLSSDSSRSRRRRRSRQKKHGGGRVASGNGNNKSSKMGMLLLQGKVKDTFAVVKRSRDPYNDFRTSMVEMIVEKQIFAPKDLEHLLQCFLTLNSHHHHRIIVEVFTEIWEALFSDWF